MPYDVIWKETEVYFTLFGIITEEDVQMAVNHFIGHPRFDEIKAFMWDSSLVQVIKVSEQFPIIPAAIVNSASSYKKEMRGAFICPMLSLSTRHIETFLEKSKQLNNPWDMQIFNTKEEALRWMIGHGPKQYISE